MSARYAYDEQPRTGHPLAQGASPHDIRAHLLPEDRPEFDRQYAQSLAEARESLDLTGLFKTLERWRGKAMLAQAIGREGIQRMMEQAEHTMRTGEPPPGSVPWTTLKAELGL